ncbi:MAG TPA: site-specific DNA-methyltransferase [Terriglobia bacterium]|nr:site-specific DNA-methyltransferase [Terriglobia bacterium]
MTELIWDGKYKDGKKQGPVRIALPFQTIETVNESAQDRLRTLELFAQGRQTEWRNRLIWGDKKYVLPSLLPEFAGKVNLIYIDPPFDTGADFSYTATIPDHPDSDDGNGTVFTKEPSIIEQKAYRDTWGRGLDSYLQWFYETVVLLRELLAEDGSIYVHLDWHLGHYAKVVLDEVLGQDNFLNEIIRVKCNPKNYTSKSFGNIHDVVYSYSKAEEHIWNKVLAPASHKELEDGFPLIEKGTGRRYTTVPLHAPGVRNGETGKRWKGLPPPKGRHWAFLHRQLDNFESEGRVEWSETGNPRLKMYADESRGFPIQDIWTEFKDTRQDLYATQKPEALIARIIKASSNEGDLVLDCFCGSGTTAAVAEKLGRRWIACDLGRFAIHTTRKRLLGIPGVKPFVVQNLGKYERQAWQAAEFDVGGTGVPPVSIHGQDAHATSALQERRQREAAYRRFILDLYHATPVSGYSWLHGAKSGRMVHVGAVDAPVTLADVKAIAKEVWKVGASSGTGVPPVSGHGQDAHATKAAVDILGWEFAFEMNETAIQIAAESRVAVSFKKIPNEALDKKAVEQGDIRFFELGALAVDVGAGLAPPNSHAGTASRAPTPKSQQGARGTPRQVTLKLADFAIPIDDIPQEVRKAIRHWSQLVDYWAVDWDYKDDTFHNQWQSYRTRKEPKIELSAHYVYPAAGKYMIVVKVIDILGNDTTKTLEVTVK